MPFEAINGFFDPSVQFGLQFEAVGDGRGAAPRLRSQACDKPAAAEQPAGRSPRTAEPEPACAGSQCAERRRREPDKPQRRRRSRAARPLPQEIAAHRLGDGANGTAHGHRHRHARPPQERAPKPTPSARSRSPADAIGARRPSARCDNFRIGESACRAADPRARASSSAPPPRSTAISARSMRGRAQAIVQAAQEVDRRQARRSFPAGRLADRLRHPDQHERQRGDRQPRQRDCSAASAARKAPVHPNDHVNMSQSSNDTLPDRDAHRGGERDRAPARCRRCTHLHARARTQERRQFAKIVKIGRTHTQDATPLTLGQEFSGYAAQVELGHRRVIRLGAEASSIRWRRAAPRSAPGSTPSRNSPRLFAKRVAAITGLPFVTAPNKFEALAVARRLCVRARRARRARRRAVQDRQRHPPARLRPALRASAN